MTQNFNFSTFFDTVAVPILVAGGGGGLGVGQLLDDETQHGKIFDSLRIEVSGQQNGDVNVTGGAGNKKMNEHEHATPIEKNRKNRKNIKNINVYHIHIGGGWRGPSKIPFNGASLLEGGLGGKSCFDKGIYGEGTKTEKKSNDLTKNYSKLVTHVAQLKNM